MSIEIMQELATLSERIFKSEKKLNDFTEMVNQEVAISVTNLEISQIEQAQQITDHDIAIIELQQKEA